MQRHILTSVLILFGLLGLTATTGAAADACADLTGRDFGGIPDAPTQLRSTRLVSDDPEAPAYCQVVGYVAPRLDFELRLPVDTWNGRLFMQGCGGFCGFIRVERANDALRKGYATVSTNLGSSSTALDGKWGYNNLQGEIDFGFRGAHVVTVAAKAIVAVFYDQPAQYAFYRGCSTGGRQGLVEAQQFPEDFDGIIAGAPPMNETRAAVIALGWPVRVNKDAAGNPILSEKKLPALNAAAIKACDDTDGIRDGIIGDPARCDFDPASLRCGRQVNDACLTPAEIDVVRNIYGGARNEAGQRLMLGGPPPGSEMRWAGYLGITSAASGNLRLMYQDFLRYMAFDQDPGPGFDPDSFDFVADIGRLQYMERFYNAENPDLRPFRDAGGKLILFLGLQDTAPQERVIDYFQTVSRVVGGVDQAQHFFRLFLQPGMNHCSGGPGADTVDWLGYLERWVINGEAPDRVIAARQKPAVRERWPSHPLPAENVEFTRPLFPYPDYAMYDGDGDPKLETSFRRVSPNPP